MTLFLTIYNHNRWTITTRMLDGFSLPFTVSLWVSWNKAWNPLALVKYKAFSPVFRRNIKYQSRGVVGSELDVFRGCRLMRQEVSIYSQLGYAVGADLKAQSFYLYKKPLLHSSDGDSLTFALLLNCTWPIAISNLVVFSKAIINYLNIIKILNTTKHRQKFKKLKSQMINTNVSKAFVFIVIDSTYQWQ